MDREGSRKKMSPLKIAIVLALVVAIILSLTVLSKAASDPAHLRKTLEALDEKKTTVLQLTAAATAASTAIAAVPGDATTPVANELADMTSYFLIVLAAIFIEKYLVTLAGFAAFSILLPVAFLCAIASIVFNRPGFMTQAAKIGLFGVVLLLVIPLSMSAAGLIERTSESSFAATADEAQEMSEEIYETADADGNILEKALNKVKGGISGVVDKGEQLLNRFIEAVAVMLVTSCILPICVLLFILWLVKMLFGLQVDIPADLPRRISRRRPGHNPAEE